MGPQREYVVSIFVAVIAILVILGGYASFSGLAVHDNPLGFDMQKSVFKQSDVFDVNIVVRPVMFMADESIVVYVDKEEVGVIALKKYLDYNSIEYGTEVKNLGQNNQEIITLKNPLTVNLVDFVTLEYMKPGTVHSLKAEFSQGDASAEGVFRVE